MEFSETIKLLKKVSLFRNLSEKALELVASVTNEVQFKSSEIIFHEGEEADDLYVITDGQVNIEKHSDGSRRKVLAILDRGDFFGEMAVITHGKRCAAAVASKRVTLLSVGKASFLNLLQKDGPLCFEILQQVCERLEAADSEIESLTFQNLPGRIAGKIIDLGKRFGRINSAGYTVIDLDVTHAGLAEMVGTNRETVSKYISIFRKEGSIEHESKQLTIKDSSTLSSWS